VLIALRYYIVPLPVVLGVVDILLFLVPLLLFILVLRSMRPFVEPSPLMVPPCIVPRFMSVVEVPFCIVPFCMVPVPLVPLCIVPPCMVPLVPVPVVPAGVVWAKATVLKQKAQAAVRINLVVFMTISNEVGGVLAA
jgi:hypothetical protein